MSKKNPALMIETRDQIKSCPAEKGLSGTASIRISGSLRSLTAVQTLNKNGCNYLTYWRN